jgi:ferredoxin
MTDGSLEPRWLAKSDLDTLIRLLRSQGYQVIGPTIDQAAIVYRAIESAAELPVGWTEYQEAAHYRLVERGDGRYFGYTVGPQSWKQYLFPPAVAVSEAVPGGDGWQFRSPADDAPRFAFLGVRACELAAIEVQDRTFVKGPYVDPIYQARRAGALIIAVNCTMAAATCFCASMGTGPRCKSGFDLALTELDDGFVVEVATEPGRSIVAALPTSETDAARLTLAQQARQNAANQITRRLDTSDIRDLLLGNLNHPRWDEVAQRCLSCANCTMVCPTCFCASVEEVTDLREERVERRRVWDSCFNVDFSYINGGVIRNTIRARYRQWLTHKLASWIDQFGVSGCVGCGRCITWCPVGIDLTEEVAAIRGQTEQQP